MAAAARLNTYNATQGSGNPLSAQAYLAERLRKRRALFADDTFNSFFLPNYSFFKYSNTSINSSVSIPTSRVQETLFSKDSSLNSSSTLTVNSKPKLSFSVEAIMAKP